MQPIYKCHKATFLLHRGIGSAAPFCHGRFSDSVSLLPGEADLSLAAVIYATSRSVIDKQGYVKNLEVKVTGLLNKNSFFPPFKSAIGSEQDVVMEEHRKVRCFSLNTFAARIACKMVLT